jgi:hypothetical protein
MSFILTESKLVKHLQLKLQQQQEKHYRQDEHKRHGKQQQQELELS